MLVRVFIDKVSVGATENILMAATMAKGESLIEIKIIMLDSII